MSPRYMLDTNIVRRIVSNPSSAVLDRVARHAPSQLCVSAITYGEIIFGLKRRPEAVKLAASNEKFFAEIDILPFTQDTSEIYGRLRVAMQMSGKALGPLDMLIAAHGLSADATLVSADRAFRHVPGLVVEDWTAA